jgi:5'-nucleotidase
VGGSTLAFAACGGGSASHGAPSDAGGGVIAADAGPDTGAPDAGHGIVSLQILAFNDFHGNIRPPDPTNSGVLVKAGDPAIDDAGGAVYFAAHMNALKAQNPNTIIVSAGDLTGASQVTSALYDDEPTIDIMNAIGLAVHGVGNHEFDRGVPTLLRYQDGGCANDQTDAGLGSCEAPPTPFPGAHFEYLAANVETNVLEDGGLSAGQSPETLFPPYVIKNVGGANLAFIGLTLSDTSPYNAGEIVGLTFADEITTVNALVAQLETQTPPVDAMIVLVHQGGSQSGTYNDCVNLEGAITSIADGIDPAVAAIHSAHTHAAYNCLVGGRPVTSAGAFGKLITQFQMTVDTHQHKVQSVTATNVVVTRDVPPDPTVEAMVNEYVAQAAPVAEQQVGQITADITSKTGSNGESPIGDVLGDGMLAYAAAQGHPSDVAFLNVGGIRDSLYYESLYGEALGDVTYEKAFNAIPFADTLVVLQCKGSDILAALQQNSFPGTVLQQSSSLTYSWSSGSGLDTSSVMINGAALVPTQVYDVVTVTFVETGGDGYTAFENCTNPVPFGVDIEAFTSYLEAHENPPLAPPAANRITKD